MLGIAMALAVMLLAFMWTDAVDTQSEPPLTRRAVCQQFMDVHRYDLYSELDSLRRQAYVECAAELHR